MSGKLNQRVRNFIHSEAEIRAIISLPTHAFVQSGIPDRNTCIVYIQKFTKQKKELYKSKTENLIGDEVRELLRTDPDFDYPILWVLRSLSATSPAGA